MEATIPNIADVIQPSGEEIQAWFRQRTIDMACPYIYPPTSRYADTSFEEIFASGLSVIEPYALYVHIPFCIYRCEFCNFALDVLADASYTIDQYLSAISEQAQRIRESAGTQIRLSSLHVGGGTPTILNARQLDRFLQILRDNFVLDDAAEFCVEVTPDTVAKSGSGKLRQMAAAGVNRVSIGAQTFDDGVLQALNRLHSSETVVEAVEAVRDACIPRVNLDLMYGLPNLTDEGWIRSLDIGCQLSPESVTVYELRIPPRSDSLTALANDRNKPIAHEYLIAHDLLESKGLIRSMPNQFVRGRGNVQRHYVDVRERLTQVLAIGVSAMGFVNSYAFKGSPTLNSYMERYSEQNEFACRGFELTREEQMRRAMVLGLKSPNGVSLSRFVELFGSDVSAVFGKEIEELTALGLIESDREYLSTNRLGSAFVDQIAATFFHNVDLASVKQHETSHLKVYWH
jgi:oxygen-independent coproporphyrinogen III oxidase